MARARTPGFDATAPDMETRLIRDHSPVRDLRQCAEDGASTRARRRAPQARSACCFAVFSCSSRWSRCASRLQCRCRSRRPVPRTDRDLDRRGLRRMERRRELGVEQSARERRRARVPRRGVEHRDDERPRRQLRLDRLPGHRVLDRGQRLLRRQRHHVGRNELRQRGGHVRTRASRSARPAAHF